MVERDVVLAKVATIDLRTVARAFSERLGLA
jgi:hypothetical protein